MPEHSEKPESAPEPSARQRMQLAGQLAEQLSRHAPPSQPSTPPSERPSPAPISQAPAMARPLVAPKPSARRAIVIGPPLLNDASEPLLRGFTDSASNYRPMSIADLLDLAFRLYRQRFTVLVGIAALSFLPMALLLLLVQQVQVASGLVQIVQSLLLVPLVSAALIYCIARLDQGANNAIGVAYRAGLSRYWALFSSALLQGILIGIPVALIFGCLFGSLLFADASSTSANIPVLTAVMVAVVVLIALPFLTRFALASQVVVLEQAGATQSLRRSWQLTRGWFWRTFGVSTCSGILSYLISALPAIMINFVIGMTGAAEAMALAPSITAVGSQLGLIVAMPLQLIISTLLYYDLRIRGEGYDLEMLAQRGLEDDTVKG
jgi:hypothetical protein